MEKERFYLACPYTHEDEDVRIERFEAVTQEAANLTAKGLLVYSPITEGHLLAEYAALPVEFAYWEAKCKSFLENWATTLCVLCLDGWKESRGVQAEIALAEILGLDILYFEEER